MEIFKNEAGVEFAIIEVAPDEFVSMLKSDYDTLASESANDPAGNK